MTLSLTPDILSTAAACTAGTRISVEHGPPRTNGSTIYLPGIKPDLNPAEAMVLRGYFDHEVAHCRYDSFMPMYRLSSGHERVMFNAVEDVRIEARSCAELPGTIGTLAAIREAAIAADRPGTMSAFEQAAHAVCWYGQGVSPERVPYCAAGWVILGRMNLSAYDKFIATAAKRSADKAVEIAKDLAAQALKIIADLNDEGTPPPPPPGDEPSDDRPDGQPDGQPDDSGDSADGGNADSSDTGDSSDSSDSSDSGAGDAPSDTGDQWSNDPGDGSSVTAAGLDGITDDVNGERVTYHGSYAIGTANQITEAYPSRVTTYPAFHRDAMQMARTLREQLMARDRVHWSQPRESGHRIDRRTLPGVASGQTVNAFNRRRVDRAINTQVTVLLDHSASMSGDNFRNAMHASWAIADACESLGCPSQIISFGSSILRVKTRGRVTPATVVRGTCGGGTRILPALIRERMESESNPKMRRVIFVITDGECTDWQSATKFIEQQRRQGATYFSLCIDMPSHPVANACDTTVSCRSEALAASMAESLRSI